MDEIDESGADTGSSSLISVLILFSLFTIVIIRRRGNINVNASLAVSSPRS